MQLTTKKMKTKILKLLTVFLLLLPLCMVMLGAGCEKEDDEQLWEISPTSESAIIQKVVDGIQFKFCLLNEQGQPATIFNEGENFTFQFIIKNQREENLPFYDYGYYELDDFLTVSSKNETYGRPFNFIEYLNTLELRWLLTNASESDIYNFNVRWHDDRDDWQLYWGRFESTKQPLLKKGIYYTQFAYNFTFGMSDNKPELETGLIKFKINFEIK